MKRYCWSILFLSALFMSAYGQQNSDYGVFGGVSGYYGDINSTRLLYAPSPSFGVVYRYNFHPRQSVRMNLFYGGLRGDDLDFDNQYQQTRGASFSNTVVEWAAQFEFNFFPYTTAGKWWDYTPYFAGGVGLAFITSPALTYTPVIPLSVGFKVNIYKNMGLEAEYGFRKTFYDNFDGLNDNIDPDHLGWVHNNDWYMFAGVTLTWKMFNNLGSCPAYYDVEKTKRKPR